MPNTLFAIVLALVAIFAGFAAFRSADRARIGWAVVAAAAAVQVWNLLTIYSMVIAIVTTLAILGGFLVARGQPGLRRGT